MFGIVGQKKVLNLFHGSLSSGRLSHSYLIEGDEGLGKLNIAKYIAAALLCKDEGNKPCGRCSSCKRSIEGKHPDIRIIDEKTIKIDNIRSGIQEVYKKPYEGDKKVLIIRGFHTATIEGQNAILKTLEEPPRGATIILLASETISILDTIISRCQVLKLFREDTSLIKNILINNGYDNDKAEFASLYGEGNYGESLKACESEFLKIREEIISMGIDVFSCSRFKALNYAKVLANEHKDHINDILCILTSLYRDIIMVKVNEKNDNIINRDYFEILVEESYRLSYNKLDKAIRVLNNTRKRLTRDTNFLLTMEVMILDIQEAK